MRDARDPRDACAGTLHAPRRLARRLDAAGAPIRKPTNQNNNTTTYSYDGVGNMTGTTDANGHLVTYIYNSVKEETE